MAKKIKVFFNREPVRGPWGGGTKVLSAIVEELCSRGHNVTYDLHEKTEIIFCMDPRSNQVSNFDDLLRKRARDNSKIIQRVGDIGTHGKPDLYDLVKNTVSLSDHVIFPSKWARNNVKIDDKKVTIIQNAPLGQFINKIESKRQDYDTIRMITHHWSDNPMKGFDIYEKFNNFCRSKKDYSFTYVGRKPDSISLENYLSPQDVDGLVKIIPQFDVYITASRKEAGANHVLEAMALGLPVLYHNDGGSIVEYCQDRGLEYSSFDHLVELLSNKERIIELIKNTPSYTRNSNNMASEYVDLLEKIHES